MSNRLGPVKNTEKWAINQALVNGKHWTLAMKQPSAVTFSGVCNNEHVDLLTISGPGVCMLLGLSNADVGCDIDNSAIAAAISLLVEKRDLKLVRDSYNNFLREIRFAYREDVGAHEENERNEDNYDNNNAEEAHYAD